MYTHYMYSWSVQNETVFMGSFQIVAGVIKFPTNTSTTQNTRLSIPDRKSL